MKTLLIVLLSCLLSSCLIPIIPTIKGGGNEMKLFFDNSKNKRLENIYEVEVEMKSCGFFAQDMYTNFSRKMQKDEYIQSSLCMEKRGFRMFKHKSTCQDEWLLNGSSEQTKSTCQAWLKEFKRW